MNEPIYLTEEGAEKIRKELLELEGPRRKEIATRLREAIQMGDLSENADYHKAKEDQGFLEGRIQELQYLINHAEIVSNNSNKNEYIDIGSKVTVEEQGYPADTYTLVGAKETDPKNGKISYESPMGKALMGKKAGERFSFKTPAGSREMEIKKVE